MRTMLVPLLQERRRKVRLPLPNPHGSLDRRFYTLSSTTSSVMRTQTRKVSQTRSKSTVYARVHPRDAMWGGDEEEEWREGGGRGDRGDRSRRVFTEPPRISHGKINLADTHREGDWTLDAVTGHGLQRLQQIACVKERTAINGCIIQYRGGGRGRGRGEGAGVCVSKCKRERRDANAKGPHHLEERIEEPRNEALDVYIYIYLLPRRKERGSGPRVEAYDVYARYEKRRNRALTTRRGCCMPAVRAPPCFLHRFTFRQAFRRLDIATLLQTAEPCTARWTLRLFPLPRPPTISLSL